MAPSVLSLRKKNNKPSLGSSGTAQRKPFRTLTLSHTLISPSNVPLKPTSSSDKAFASRQKLRLASAVTKAHEKELKEEKSAAKEELVRKIREKREARAEKERYEALEAKMHKKRVERLRRREKRNKALKS